MIFRMRFFLLGFPFVIAAAVVGCGDDADVDPSTGGSGGPGGTGGSGGAGATPPVSSEELLELGPWDVGFREMTLAYPGVASDEDRELPMRMWYPAIPDSGADPALYAVAAVVEVPTDVALDAPPLADGSGFPLAIYSHGSGGQALLAYPFGELMASHGWIVASPNHIGNTALDQLAMTSVPGARSQLNRPNDVSAVIDWLESGLTNDDLAGAADTARVFVIGHSFGAYTAFAVGGGTPDFDVLTEDCDGDPNDSCMVYAEPEVEAAFRAGFGDPRVVAIAPQAPGVPTGADLAALDVPTMLMSGLLDQTTPHATQAAPAWAMLDHPDDVWVDMPMGAHVSFITICHDLAPSIINIFQPDAFDDGCDFDRFTPTDEAVPVIAAYLLAFGRLHVLGETAWDTVLRGETIGEIDDQFEITVR